MQSRGWTDKGCVKCDLAPVLDHRGDRNYPYLVSEPELLESVQSLVWTDSHLGTIFEKQPFRILQHISSVIKGGKGFPSPCFQYCEANSPNFFVYGADGLIYPCGEAIGNPELAIGRFIPAHEIWPEKEKVWRTRSIVSIPECRNCNMAGFCGGGCTYSALIQHGSPHVGMCGHSHEVFELYCRTLAGNVLGRHDGKGPGPSGSGGDDGASPL
jgi:uncharacterized protein